MSNVNIRQWRLWRNVWKLTKHFVRLFHFYLFYIFWILSTDVVSLHVTILTKPCLVFNHKMCLCFKMCSTTLCCLCSLWILWDILSKAELEILIPTVELHRSIGEVSGFRLQNHTLEKKTNMLIIRKNIFEGTQRAQISSKENSLELLQILMSFSLVHASPLHQISCQLVELTKTRI